MSYILEALKKSDQQRQRGATPTLLAAQTTVAAPKQPLFVPYSLLAVALLGAGIAIGWLRPWQAEQPAHAAEPIATRPPTPVMPQAAPSPTPKQPETTIKATQEWPTQNSIPAVQPTRRADAMQPDLATPVRNGMRAAAPEMPVSPADKAQEQKAVPMIELPLAIRQDIPAMTIQLHAFSNDPMNRLVSINSRMLHEGESLVEGLRLEQITPDGLIFNYKGYRFQHGIQ